MDHVAGVRLGDCTFELRRRRDEDVGSAADVGRRKHSGRKTQREQKTREGRDAGEHVQDPEIATVPLTRRPARE